MPESTAPSMRRRQVLASGAALLAGAASLGAHAADAWPSRTVQLILPAAPGGSSDPMARLIAEQLSASLGQAFVVANRPGANGNIGAAMAAKAPKDGYTLLLGWPGTIVSAVTMYDSKPFNPERDFDPALIVASVPNVVVINPSTLPVNSLKELEDYARSHPGVLNFGSTGSGSSYHLSGELFDKVHGVKMVHVPYTSPGAVFSDLLGGRLQVAFPGTAAVASLVKEGKLKALAVMSEQRSPAMPNVPTAKELGEPNLVSETWFAVLAPKGTPSAITAKINETMNAALATPAFKDKLESMGYTPWGGTAERFTKTLRDDIVKWGEIVKFSGAKVD